MKNQKRKAFYGTLEPFKGRQVKYLTPYYYQDGAWHLQEDLSKRKDEDRVAEILNELDEIGARLGYRFETRVKGRKK